MFVFGVKFSLDKSKLSIERKTNLGNIFHVVR